MGCQCTKYIRPVEFFILHGADMIRAEQNFFGNKLTFTYKTHTFTFYIHDDIDRTRLVHENNKGYVSCHTMTEYIDAMNRVVEGGPFMSPPDIVSCNIWNSETEKDKKELRFDFNGLPIHIQSSTWTTLHQLCETMDIVLSPISATRHAMSLVESKQIPQLRQKIIHSGSLNVKWRDFTHV